MGDLPCSYNWEISLAATLNWEISLVAIDGRSPLQLPMQQINDKVVESRKKLFSLRASGFEKVLFDIVLVRLAAGCHEHVAKKVLVYLK